MISEWRLGQFKSVTGLSALPLRPLTVLAGANSSGKSTILQSMLLLAQTLASKVSHRPVILNGDMLKLGTFSDVLSERAQSEDITIGFTIRTDLSAHQQYWRFPSTRRSFWHYGDMPYNGEFSVELILGPREAVDEQTSRKSLTLQAQLRRAVFEASLTPHSPAASSSHPVTSPKQRLELKRRTLLERQQLWRLLPGGFSDDLSAQQAFDYEVIPSDASSWTWTYYGRRANAHSG
jgi:hypothetical protein